MEEIAGYSTADVDLLIMDGYDDCIAGVVERMGQHPIVCYDREMILRKLQGQGMTPEEALEFHDFNQMNSWVGELTPCFITLTENIA